MNSTLSSPTAATSVSNCDRIPILLDPVLIKYLSRGIRCKAQLMTEELELDDNEVPVPKDWKLIELVVLEDNRQIIEQIIASTPEYVGYKVVDHWQVCDNEKWF